MQVTWTLAGHLATLRGRHGGEELVEVLGADGEVAGEVGVVQPDRSVRGLEASVYPPADCRQVERPGSAHRPAPDHQVEGGTVWAAEEIDEVFGGVEDADRVERHGGFAGGGG